MKILAALFLVFLQASPARAQVGLSPGGCFGSVEIPFAGISIMSPRSYLGVQDLEDVVQWMNRDFGGEVDARVDYEAMAFNGSAGMDGNRKIVTLNLGLILHPKISKDVIALIGCHELGHHLAGAPLSSKQFQFSVEGQADYFAPQGCFDKWLDAKVLSSYTIRSEVTKYCQAFSPRTSPRFDRCTRAIEAAVRLSEIFADKKRSPQLPDLFAVEQIEVSTTIEAHASPQCRLDTFKAGYISHIWSKKPRPRCWFRDDQKVVSQ